MGKWRQVRLFAVQGGLREKEEKLSSRENRRDYSDIIYICFYPNDSWNRR